MKKNKKIIKIILSMLLLLTIGLIITNNVFAWEIGSVMNKMDNVDAGNSGNKLTKVMGAIINMFATVGAGLAIIMLIVIGIQYISKGAEGKAEAKKDLTGYVVGAVILFGVSGILKILQMFIDANVNNV